MDKEDLQKIRDNILRECPSCDMGLPHACVCPGPEFDYRPIMLRLVGEIEAYRMLDERVRESIAGVGRYDGMSRRDLAWLILKHEDHRARTEAALAEQYEAIQAYEAITGMSAKRAIHFAECDGCGGHVDTSKCAKYHEIEDPS